MIKIFNSIFLVLALSPALQGQDSLSYSIVSLSVGARQTFNKDKFQSPYTYKGINPTFHVAYLRVTPKRKHIIDLNYTTGKMKSIVSPRADNQLLFLGYDFLLSGIPDADKSEFSFSMGPGIQTFLSRTHYLPDVELSNSYVSAGGYLAVSGDIAYHLTDRSSLELKVSIPVMGIIHRPDFEINGKSLTKAAYISEGMLFNSRLQYVCNLKSEIDVTASYDVNYFSFKEPRLISILSGGLSIGVSRKF